MRGSIDRLTRDLELLHPLRERLQLEVGALCVLIRSNSRALADALVSYFGADSVRSERDPDVEISAIVAPTPNFRLEFREWPRAAGKRGQKEIFADGDDGRVVLKVRTGMQFLMGRERLLAVGPCVENVNQVVNFIISQYISRLIHQGWVLCHAAGVSYAPGAGAALRGIGIAARAGAGKSTLTMQLMGTGLSFTSNDRLLVRSGQTGAEMAGVPKMPRVNPVTLLNDPNLAGILPERRARELRELPEGELWELEEKYDVFIDEAFGAGRTVYRAPLSALMILNWTRAEKSTARFEPVRLAERGDLLECVMKSPGVFHRSPDGAYTTEASRPAPREYLDALAGVPLFEATGRPNFTEAVSFCRRLLESEAR
jgi:HprK-related kinase B